MAVVSISRIQIRRGRKNEGSGLPQLASGEFAWAVDTQELYIGNGSVAEGAPYVGNTKILTEKDNILEFASLYEYKQNLGYIQTGEFSNIPVRRSLQDRLDDFVSIKSFGANGDATNQTAAIQRAIFQLFLNPSAQFNLQSRAVLHFNAGEYLITDTIYIPPFCVIRGAGPEKTLIRKRTPGPAFQTVSSLSTITNPVSLTGATRASQARNIFIDGIGLSLETGASGFDIKGCRDSQFSNIKITGDWTLDSALDDNLWGIHFESTNVCTVNNVKFNNIEIENLAYGIRSTYDVKDTIVDNSKFTNLGKAVLLGTTQTPLDGQSLGASNNQISNSVFDNVREECIQILKGDDNLSIQNKFYTVGCWNAGTLSFDAQVPNRPILSFALNSTGNSSKDDWFERTETTGKLFSTSINYVPEIAGPSFNDYGFSNYIQSLGLINNLDAGFIFSVPADSYKSIEVEYIWNLFSSTNVDTRTKIAVRKGTLQIAIAPGNSDTQNLISDDYSYVGDLGHRESLRFTGTLYDKNNDGNIDTYDVRILNYILSNQSSSLQYRIKTIA